MPTLKKRISFFDSAEGIEIEQTLRHMATDRTYNTMSNYSANTMQYPDNRIPFVDKHMNYLNAHPSVDPVHYIANLRLMTRIR